MLFPLTTVKFNCWYCHQSYCSQCLDSSDTNSDNDAGLEDNRKFHVTFPELGIFKIGVFSFAWKFENSWWCLACDIDYSVISVGYDVTWLKNLWLVTLWWIVVLNLFFFWLSKWETVSIVSIVSAILSRLIVLFFKCSFCLLELSIILSSRWDVDFCLDIGCKFCRDSINIRVGSSILENRWFLRAFWWLSHWG